MDNIMSNDKHQPNGTQMSVVKQRPRKTAFGKLRNKRQNELAAALNVSLPRTRNNSALVYTKRWNGYKVTRQ